MKLATYKDGSRDGQLVVVSRDLSTAHFANGIATRLQQVLDDWNFLSPQLEDLSLTLNHGKARHAFAFDPAMCMAPLPRAFQWVGVAAHPLAVERRCQALGLELPAGLRTDPPTLQQPGDQFLGATDELVLERPEDGLDVEAGLAVVTGDIARGAAPAQALEGVRLLMLAAGWVLREREGGGARPPASFAPVAVTPDELGEAWSGGRVHLPVSLAVNGRKLGLVDAAADMPLHLGQLLARLARTRELRSGSLMGVGPLAAADLTRGHASLADKRAQEQIEGGSAHSAWLQWGDRVQIDAKGRDGHSAFGAIDQTVVEPA